MAVEGLAEPQTHVLPLVVGERGHRAPGAPQRDEAVAVGREGERDVDCGRALEAGAGRQVEEVEPRAQQRVVRALPQRRQDRAGRLGPAGRLLRRPGRHQGREAYPCTRPEHAAELGEGAVRVQPVERVSAHHQVEARIRQGQVLAAGVDHVCVLADSLREELPCLRRWLDGGHVRSRLRQRTGQLPRAGADLDDVRGHGEALEHRCDGGLRISRPPAVVVLRNTAEAVAEAAHAIARL